MAKLSEADLKWKVHVDAAKAARQTLSDYAREHKLNLQTLYSHSRRINKPGKAPAKPAFVRVAPAASSVGAVRIELPNGVRVHVSAPFDLPALLSCVFHTIPVTHSMASRSLIPRDPGQ